MQKGLLLIVFAWMMESVGVTAGLINSTYTTFGQDLPNTFVGYLPAVPMVALAVAELGRIPLASVVYHRRKFIQGLAIIGMVALGYLAVENWTFGFERVVDIRLKSVNETSREVSSAEATLQSLNGERARFVAGSSLKRDELRRGLDTRDGAIASLTAQLTREAEIRQKNLESIREACRIIRDRCMVPRSEAEDARYAAAVRQMHFELTKEREERARLQAQIEALTGADARSVTDYEIQVASAAASANEARKAFRAAVDANQIYRLAASWFGVSTSEVTQEQFATARWVFATFSAIAVALAGSIAALVYYAPARAADAPTLSQVLSAKVARARRAYYARRRKPLVREVPGPERVVYREGKEQIVVEKEVPRIIERIVLVPRFGIRFPTYVNSLINPRDANRVDRTDNVTPFDKKAV